MKTKLLLVALFFSFLSFSHAQELDSLGAFSRLSLLSTSGVMPGVSVGVQGGASAFTTENNVYRLRGIVSFGGLAEVDVANIGEIRNMLYSIRPQTSWGLKLKLIPEEDMLPAVALTVRSSVNWQPEWHDYGVMQNSRPDLYRQGLAIVRYEYGFSIARLLFSKTVYTRTILSASIGIEDVQLRGVWFWGTGLNYNFPILLMADGVKHNLSVQGFVSVAHPVSTKLSIMAEAESIPYLTPNSSLSSLNVDRAYCGSLGLRYFLSSQVALDATYFTVTDFSNHVSTELRVGLFMFLRTD